MPRPEHGRLTRAQREAWDAVVAAASALPAADGDGNGWLFHGTHHLAATHIIAEGFRDLHRRDLPPEQVHVFFADLRFAAAFAERNMDADSPPCLIAVRTSDVAHALRSDDRYEGWVEDWKGNLARGGAVRTTADVPMPSIRRIGIEGFGLPLHPNALPARGLRHLAGKPVHPDDLVGPDDMVFAEPEGEPSEGDLWLRETYESDLAEAMERLYSNRGP